MGNDLFSLWLLSLLVRNLIMVVINTSLQTTIFSIKSLNFTA